MLACTRAFGVKRDTAMRSFTRLDHESVWCFRLTYIHTLGMGCKRSPKRAVSSGFIGNSLSVSRIQSVVRQTLQRTSWLPKATNNRFARDDGATTVQRRWRRRGPRPLQPQSPCALITSSFSVVGVSQAAAGQHLAYAFGVSLPPTMLAWFGSTGTSMTTEFDGANSLTPVVWVLGAVAGLVVSHLAQQSPAAVRKAWLRFIRGADAREANPTCPACEGEGSIDCLCQRWRVPDASSDSSESRSEPKGPLQKASRGWNLFSKSRTRVALTKSTCSRCHGTGREPCPRCGGGGMLVHSDEASLRGDTVPVHLEDGYDWERAARLKRDSR